MARRRRRPPAQQHKELTAVRTRCVACGGPLWVGYHSHRTLATLEGLVRLRLQVRRCLRLGCPQYHRPYRPEEELGWALPHGEFGLDIIALVGALRFGEHRSVPEIHRELARREVAVAERTVTHLVQRYEELLAVRLSDLGVGSRLHDVLVAQARVILAIDGLQPDVGHEVLWVVRDCLSGEILLARSLLSGREAELAALLGEVQTALTALRPGPVTVAGVVSDGQHSIRNAVASALPGVPHQLCHFHYLREAALPAYEADRHAKKELKKQVRGVRPIERALEEREVALGVAPNTTPSTTADALPHVTADALPHVTALGVAADLAETAVARAYCLAVRSALTDDGRPPLVAAGLRLHERLTAIHTSIERVRNERRKRGTRGRSHAN